MPPSPSSYGFSTDDFAKRFPGQTAAEIQSMASEQGLDGSDPKVVAGIRYSSAFNSRLQNYVGNKKAESKASGAQRAASSRDDRILNRVAQPLAPRQYDINAPLSTMVREESIYSNDMHNRARIGREIALRKIQELEGEKELSKSDFINKRSKELARFDDLDQRKLELEKQQIMADINLRAQLGHLPPNMRQQVLASRQGVFLDAMDQLEEVRQLRHSKASSAAENEYSEYSSKMKSTAAKRAMYERMLEDFDAADMDPKDRLAFMKSYKDAVEDEKKAKQSGGNVGIDFKDPLIRQLYQEAVANGFDPNMKNLSEIKQLVQTDPNSLPVMTGRHSIYNPNYTPRSSVGDDDEFLELLTRAQEARANAQQQ